MKISHHTLDTPIGRVTIAWKDDVVVAVEMSAARAPGRWDTEYRLGPTTSRLRARLARRFGEVDFVAGSARAEPARALARYFDGTLDALDALEADPGGTELQAAIWSALRGIPPGTTWTYGALARHVGRPNASRAAGRTVGTNPIPLVVPCHRIIGADGSLTGFGGGLSRKRWLLEHEGALQPGLIA